MIMAMIISIIVNPVAGGTHGNRELRLRSKTLRGRREGVISNSITPLERTLLLTETYVFPLERTPLELCSIALPSDDLPYSHFPRTNSPSEKKPEEATPLLTETPSGDEEYRDYCLNHITAPYMFVVRTPGENRDYCLNHITACSVHGGSLSQKDFGRHQTSLPENLSPMPSSCSCIIYSINNNI